MEGIYYLNNTTIQSLFHESFNMFVGDYVFELNNLYVAADEVDNIDAQIGLLKELKKFASYLFANKERWKFKLENRQFELFFMFVRYIVNNELTFDDYLKNERILRLIQQVAVDMLHFNKENNNARELLDYADKQLRQI